MITYIFYGAALIALTISFFKSKAKTVMALRKSWKAFENIMPDFLSE